MPREVRSIESRLLKALLTVRCGAVQSTAYRRSNNYMQLEPDSTLHAARKTRFLIMCIVLTPAMMAREQRNEWSPSIDRTTRLMNQKSYSIRSSRYFDCRITIDGVLSAHMRTIAAVWLRPFRSRCSWAYRAGRRHVRRGAVPPRHHGVRALKRRSCARRNK